MSCNYEVQVLNMATVCEISTAGRLNFGREATEGFSEADLRRSNGKQTEVAGGGW